MEETKPTLFLFRPSEFFSDHQNSDPKLARKGEANLLPQA